MVLSPRRSLALTLVLLAGLCARAEAVSINAPAAVVPGGSSAQVAISVTDAPASAGYTGLDLFLRYDGDIAEVVSVSTAGTAIDGWDIAYNVFENVDGSTDELRISAASFANLDVSGTETLLLIEFSAAAVTSPTSTSLTFALADLNESAVPTTAGSIAIGGTDGQLQLSPSTLLPGADLTVQLDDADLTGAVSVSVTVTNSTTSESEELSLTESPANSGTFSATLSTAFAVAAGTDDDGTLGAKMDDIITASYADALGADGQAGSVAADSDATILGGSTATLVLSGSPLYPGGSIDIELTDSDAVGDGSLTVTVSNTTTGDSETVTLTETGSGVFTGSIGTEYSTSGTSADGVLGVARDDVISASYDDPVNDIGGTETIGPAPGGEITILGGDTGALTLSPLDLTPGLSLTVTVTDSDLTGDGSLTVTVSNTTTGDTEMVTLTETPANSGIFVGSLSTLFDPGSSGTSGNGVLGIKTGDGIGATYQDERNDDGGPETIGGDLTISGGTNGTVSISPATIFPGESVTVTVVDADLAGDGSVDVTVRSETSGGSTKETTTATLSETGTPGTFSGTVTTVFAAAASAGGPLDVQKDDEIEAEYADALTSTGGTATVVSPTSVAVLGGTLASLRTSLGVQAGDGLRIELTDPDLDTDSGSKQTVDVTVTNLSGGDTETVTLEETGVATGIFRVTPPMPTGPGGSSGDDVLQVSPQDELQVAYDDLLDAAGGPTTVTATTTGALFGDTSANGTVRALDAALILQENVGLVTFDDYQNLVGDVNPPTDPGDYPQVNADDASKILMFAVGLITEFPIQTGVPSPHPYKRLHVTRRLAIGEPRVVDGRTRLPILADDVTGLLAGNLTLTFDEARMRVVDVVASERTTGFTVVSHAADGRLNIAFAGAEIRGEGEGALVDLELESLTPDALASLQLSEAKLNGGSTPVALTGSAASLSLPQQFALLQNWPNPFNPETQIRYELAEATHVRLRIYDLAGQVVRELVDEQRAAGTHTVRWNGLNATGAEVASGAYFYRLEAGGATFTRKMSLLR
jgi:hypothetical protein